MVLVRRLAAWCAVVAVARCSLNTPEEVRKGREALELWRRKGRDSGCPDDRIFGGFVTFVSLYPFAVFWYSLSKDNLQTCSGSIVAPMWVLTARHCILTMDWEGVIFAGDVDFTTDRVFTKVNIQIRIAREAYRYWPPQPDHLDHDILLLVLWRAFTIVRDYVAVIPITEDKTYPADFKKICTIVGFGRRARDAPPYTGIQRGGSFLMEPGQKCGLPEIKDNGLCTFDVQTKSACKGDSGGPVFCGTPAFQTGLIVGVVYKNECAKWCGAPAQFNYHIFVGFYRDWILSRIHEPFRVRSAAVVPAASQLISLCTLAVSLLSFAINDHSSA
ncbi:trypsin 3A1-like [Schistocerca piceifrons]|uniref:trypsin 3A1-like n=1 Tax=Schistocerca piceifrons TaxID=274613 RepID=UPI001F5EAA22|nr:trypsin 3A1-like [Schistocerca piceifrons]